MKKTYYVEITETLQKIISVKANSEDEAISFVKEKYYDGEFVLDSENYIDTEIYTLDESEYSPSEDDEVYDAEEDA